VFFVVVQFHERKFEPLVAQLQAGFALPFFPGEFFAQLGVEEVVVESQTHPVVDGDRRVAFGVGHEPEARLGGVVMVGMVDGVVDETFEPRLFIVVVVPAIEVREVAVGVALFWVHPETTAVELIHSDSCRFELDGVVPFGEAGVEVTELFVPAQGRFAGADFMAVEVHVVGIEQVPQPAVGDVGGVGVEGFRAVGAAEES